MANDTITLNAGTGGSELAGDLNGSSEFYQRVKLVDGTDASDVVIASGNGTATSSLRVTLASDSSGQVKLAAGSAVVGEVSIGAATYAAGDLAKRTDEAATTSDVGIAALAKRTATPANYSGTDGDWEPLQVSAGRAWCWAAGDIADDAAAGTQPVLIGGYAINVDGSDPGSVSAEGDAAQVRTDRNRRILVNDAHPNLWKASDNRATAATDVELVAAPGANLSLHVTDIIVSALTAQTIKLVEATAGSTDVLEVIYLGANTTVTINLKTPLRVTANTNLGFTSTAAVATSITVLGYTAP